MSPTHTTPDTETLSKPKTILLAEHAGYCHGVKKAVDKAIATREGTTQPVYVLGQLIHNQQVIDHLSQQEIITVNSLDEVPAGSVCVIRTHGSTPEVVEDLASKNVAVSDATCPDVRLVQNKAIELANDGYTVVVVGKEEHPEVVGIMAHARRTPGTHIVAVNRVEDLEPKLADLPKRRIGVVSQTTQLEEAFFDMVKRLSMIAKELKVFNTICPATFYRQNAALTLSNKVQFMVVVGGKNSSNTTHLAEICKEQGTPTVHIETYNELETLLLCGNTPEAEALKKSDIVGVTAGASTPDWLIDEVTQYLQKL